MNIQIDGLYFPNKGDELMFYAIVQAVSKFEDINPLLIYGVGKGSPDPHILRKTGVFQLSNLQRFKIRFDKFFPKATLFKYGLICPEDVDIIFDSGGFQFGDQWANRYSEKMCSDLSKYYEWYIKRGVKIIQLPQAFGPFNNPLAKKVINIVAEYSELIFARDKESYKYLIEATGLHKKIILSPDFTCLVEGNSNVSNLLPKDFIVVIPNTKMITNTNDNIRDNYVNFNIDLINKFINAGENIVLLNHEGEGDQLIIEQINSGSKEKCTIINNINSIEIKSIIKQAKLLISSRFHGAVSGLSQGIPTFCISWSHKYLELLRDYGVENHLLDVNDIDSSFDVIKPFLSDNASYKLLQNNKIEMQKEKVHKMWNIIYDLGIKNEQSRNEVSR